MADNVLLDLIGKQTMEARQLSRDNLQSNMDLVRRSEQTATNLGRIYESVADAQYLKTITEDLGRLNAQQAAQARARQLGVNPELATDALASTLGEVNKKTAETYSLMQDWQKNQTVSFFDSPVEWVKARFNEDTLQTNLTQTAAQADFLTKKAQNINNLVQQSALTENAIKTSITTASIEANATIISAEARIAAERAELEAFAANSRGVKAALDATSEQLGFAYNYANAVRQEQNTDMAFKQLSLSQQRFGLDKESQQWNRNFKEEERAAKQEGKDLDSFYAEKINIGAAALGLPTYPEGPALKGMLQLFKNRGSVELDRLFHVGMRSTAAGTAMIGTSPAESIRTLEAGHNLPAGKEGAMGILYRAREAALQNPTLDQKKDPAKYDQYINQFVKEELTRASTNITKDSPRYIGDLKSYLGDPNAEGGITSGISALVALPITQKVLKPLIASGQALDDPAVIRALGAKAVYEGVITSSEYSSGLSQIFQRANELALQSNHYAGFGMALPQAGKNYLVSGGMFSKPVDMTNATQLGQELAKDLARRVSPTGGARRGGTAGEMRSNPYVPQGF